MSRFFIIIAFLMSAGAVFAADSLMEDVIYLDTVTVEGQTETQENLSMSEAKVVEKNRSNNIADFLAKDPEISMKRKAAFGDSGDILSIRGMESKRIMLNLDGRSISSTGNVGGNYIDFGTIPLDSIDRIEIIKGGSSAEYGNNSLGGVINAFTQHPSEKPAMSFYGTIGGWDNADDFHNVRGSYSQQFGAFGINLGISHQEAEAYLLNNDYKSFHIAPKLYLKMPWDGEFTFGYNYTKTRRGLIRTNRDDGAPASDTDPTLAGFNTKIYDGYPLASGETFAGGTPTPSMTVIGDGAYWNKVRQLFDVSYVQSIGTNAYAEVSAYKNIEDRREKNYADISARLEVQTSPLDTFDPSLTSEGDLVLDRKIKVDRSYGYKIKTVADFDLHTVTAGAEQKHLKSGGIDVKYVDKNYNIAVQNGWTGAMASSNSGSKAINDGVFISDTYRPTDRLTLNFGLRYDRFDADNDVKDYNESAVTPKAGATYSLTGSDKVSLFVYQNYRTPTLPELYWNSQSISGEVSYLEGKDFKAEKANAVDIAYRHNFSKQEYIQISAYYYDVKDYIMHKAVPVSYTSTRTSWAAYNADAKFLGTAVSGTHKITGKLSGSFGAAWQKTKKENDPADPNSVLEEVDYIPDWKADLGLSWRVTQKTSVDTGANYVGTRYYARSTDDKVELGGYTTVDMSIKHRFTRQLTFEVYADNITDTDYEESWSYPALGFNMGVSVKWIL